jgi:hypothetical protein
MQDYFGILLQLNPPLQHAGVRSAMDRIAARENARGELGSELMQSYYIGAYGRPCAAGEIARIDIGSRGVVATFCAYSHQIGLLQRKTGVLLLGADWCCAVQSDGTSSRTEILGLFSQLSFRSEFCSIHACSLDSLLEAGRCWSVALPSGKSCSGCLEFRSRGRRLVLEQEREWRACIEDSTSRVRMPIWSTLTRVVCGAAPPAALFWESDRLFQTWEGSTPLESRDRIALLALATYVSAVCFRHDDPG